MMIGNEYAVYRQILAAENKRPAREWTFKSNPAYRQILEHVTAEQGNGYLSLLHRFSDWNLRSRTMVAETAIDNDRLGHPIRANYNSLGIACSPTNLRYAWQAFTFWQHVKNLGLTNIHIIEIGGGYGGLALFVHRLAKQLYAGTFSYTIVDVLEAGAIQEAYADALNITLDCVDGTDADALDAMIQMNQDTTRILVSCYGFSEFSTLIRNWYERKVIRYCPHGFLLWNMIPVYTFTETPITIENEQPLTGPGNKIILY